MSPTVSTVIFQPPPGIQVVEVFYLELLHAAWDRQGRAVLLHVLRLLLLGFLRLLLQHRLANLQQQALRRERDRERKMEGERKSEKKRIRES